LTGFATLTAFFHISIVLTKCVHESERFVVVNFTIVEFVNGSSLWEKTMGGYKGE